MISTSKTETQCISRHKQKVDISIDGVKLNQVEHFAYLGGVVSHDAHGEANLKRRVNLVTGVASVLKTVWESRELGKKTKVRVFET